MDSEKYGVKLSLDISEFEKNSEKAKDELKDLEEPRKVKITGLEDFTNEIQIGNNKFKEGMEETARAIDDVKARISSGAIKIDDPLADMDFEELDNSYNEMINKLNNPVKLNVDTSEASNTLTNTEEKVNNVSYTLRDRLDAIADRIKEKFYGIKNAVNDTTNVILTKMSGSFKKINTDVSSSNSKIKLLKRSMDSLGNSMSKTFNKGMSTLKRYTLALFGIQSAYRMVSRAASAYLSYDQELSKSLSSTWAGLGSFLAPILEYLIGAFQKLLAYINAIVTALTGINFVARANAKAMANAGKSASNAGKQAQKALAPFDELNNIKQDTSSGGAGSGVDQITLPEVDTSKVEAWAKRLKELFNKGDFYEIGAQVGQWINDGLEKIPWNTIYDKAYTAGKNVALFINGGMSTLKPETVGKTIAGTINTGVKLIKGFVDTLSWATVGDWIKTSVTTTIKEIHWDEAFQTISDAIGGIATALAHLLDNSDGKWDEAQMAIINGLLKIDPSKLLMGLTELALVLVTNAIKVMLGIPLWDKIFELMFPKAHTMGKDLIEGVIKGLEEKAKDLPEGVRKWAYDVIIKTFKSLFGIHSPSTVMKGLAGMLVEGIIEGLKSLPGKIVKVFTDFKTTVQTKLIDVATNARTWSTNISTKIKDGISNGLSNLKTILTSPFKTALNGVIGLINSMVNKINSKLSISISGTLAKVLSALGVKVNNGKYQLLSIPNIPALRVGTDEVYEDGMAYLHKGEKVVPANIAKGGYSGSDNEETNNLLRELIEAINDKDYNPYITVDDIGKASVNYIRKKSRIEGEAII